MLSLEQRVKDQFSKVFTSRDWRLFKEIAEINFSEAAKLKKSDFSSVPADRQLLIRNIRKRLFIGIGVELLLKAAYLKAGYGINKPLDQKTGPVFPYRLSTGIAAQLNKGETYTLSQLIDQLKKVFQLTQPNIILEGLRVAKVFRNKEGHTATSSHRFDPGNYHAIESALVALYAQVFNESLTVKIAFAAREKGVWRVAL